MNNKFLPKGSLQIPKEVNRWNRQGNQPWYLYVKTAKKARKLLRIICKCRLTVYFFCEKIYSQFEIISAPVHCDVRSQTSVDRGLDFQWQEPHLLHVASIHCSTVICHHVTLLLRNVACDCCFRLSEQSLHTHFPSREETIEQRPSNLTDDYEMELLYEYDLEFCAQIIHPPKQTIT